MHTLSQMEEREKEREREHDTCTIQVYVYIHVVHTGTIKILLSTHAGDALMG